VAEETIKFFREQISPSAQTDPDVLPAHRAGLEKTGIPITPHCQSRGGTYLKDQ